ncbi:hypothetical protein FE391_43920 [Nonomuraea sp. KC401]|uniref:hypothetical protein n=1 Tax=unclassified Nonomuraea TaxID=2593643 RepID=UPI0010FDDB75|nr:MULTISPECIES: hypothetical protein [unclassified Nonomuraea]NBE99063.1 hypothetical protein [Nonomuraea sp. K271]TLF52011.1 hypothetical protein FE391_43920 [Nonomuraea sp. KC401]
MAVNQMPVILAPPVPGPLTNLTGSFAPAWALLATLTAVTLTTTQLSHTRERPGNAGSVGVP